MTPFERQGADRRLAHSGRARHHLRRRGTPGRPARGGARGRQHHARGRRPGLPYHRVIAASGKLGGYSSLSLKRSLLAAEGLTVTPGRVVGFAKIRWPRTGPGEGAAGAGRKADHVTINTTNHFPVVHVCLGRPAANRDGSQLQALSTPPTWPRLTLQVT